MTRVGILGATGYTALELMKILLRHPHVEICVLTSRQTDSPHVAMVHPQLASRLDLTLEEISPQSAASQVDCIFSCLPHAASAGAVKEVLRANVRVVDFSADYRLDDESTYNQWYGGNHLDADRISQTVYGLPELFGEKIRDEMLIANPGCFPTSAILALAPLLKANLIHPKDIIIDSKSGVSGAGRSPKLTTHFPECNESLTAYNVGRHRHTPEIEQVLRRYTGREVQVVFTPHLAPMDRGILSTIYAVPVSPISEEEILKCLREHYLEKPFVRIVDHLPGVKDVTGTNFCDITARVVGDRIVFISCLDNLVKGASGAAVQNFNLMFGYPETIALL